MFKSNIKFLLFVFLVFLSGFIFFGTNAADNNLNVQLTVPGNVVGCGSNCPVADSVAPVISSVIASTTSNSAVVSWLVTDNVSVSNVTFAYGLTQSYDQSSAPINNTSASLSNLAINTVYYYKITATDSSSNSSNHTGSFQTSAAPDITPPVISQIATSGNYSEEEISFITNENATSQINYGLTPALGSSAFGGDAVSTSHRIHLFGLLPNTIYFYKVIATDSSLNSGSSAIFRFKTGLDSTPPPDVANFDVSEISNALSLRWTNPSLSFTPDFKGVKILRKTGSKASGPSDVLAKLAYTGTEQSFIDTTISANTTYFYMVYSYDTSGNFSAGVYDQGRVTVVVLENCDNKIDDNDDGIIDCNDENCKSQDICKIKIIPENCSNNVDDDNDGKKDCEDTDCAAVDSCKIVVSENCSNKVDDDGDAKIDCADTECINDLVCKPKDVEPTSTDKIVSYACNDGKDNDSDGLVDFPSDPGCTDSNDSDEYNPKDTTVRETERLSFGKLLFFAGARQIQISSNGNVLNGLAGSNLSIGIKKNLLVSAPKNLILRIGDAANHQFSISNETYYADVLFPISGRSQAYVEITYEDGQFDSLEVNLQAVGFGQVKEDGNLLPGAEIGLYKDNGDIFNASIYGQQNPQITDGQAAIGWVVPNGKYYLKASKDGFYEFSSAVFTITNNIVNQSVSLVKIPPKLEEVIDPDASVGENVVNIAENLGQKAKASTVVVAKQVEKAAQAVQNIVDDPSVKQVANNVIAPTAVGVAAVGTAALVSWADLVSLMRFLFLQPLLLLGRGKREKWGSVYSSLSKMPVDLAIIRLINAETGKIVQTKVTSSDGRYFFVVNEGRYRLEAKKGNFVFPTTFLKEYQTDGQHLDIYHGEEIIVTAKGSVITANIPLDPAGQILKTPMRLILTKILKRVQHAVSWIGFIITVISLYISPTWYMWILLIVHIILTFGFRRLAKPPVSKGWGIVYDLQNKKPLSRVVARLFDAKFNKLVASEITDNDGRYYFMAGDNQYYISFERDGYEPLKTDPIDLHGQQAQTIAQDVGLQKNK